MPKTRRKPVLTDTEYQNLIRLCSAVADDPRRMMIAILILMDSVSRRDAEWLKTRLRLTGDNSQVKF